MSFDENKHSRDRRGKFSSHVGAEQEGSLVEDAEGIDWNDDGYGGWVTEINGTQLEVRPTTGDAALIAPFRAQVGTLGDDSLCKFASSEEEAMNWAERQAHPSSDQRPHVDNPHGPVQYVDSPVDDHGQPCAQCGMLDAPTVATVHYVDVDTREDATASTCAQCATKVVNEYHDPWRGDAVIEVSTVPA